MPIGETEALACLRVLVAVARVDGTVHHDERKSLSAALESLALPEGTTIASLLETDVDVDAELARLASDEAREQVYRSAYFMAHADGEYDPKEAELLAKIERATGPSADVKASLERLFPAADEAPASSFVIHPIEDPAERASAIEGRVFRYACLATALGAFPIPGLAIATDLAVVALQLKMIRDVGAYHGNRVDRASAKSLLYGVGLGTGARLAIANLAKLVPGWGSIVGATSSFVSTYALGKVIASYFEGGVASSRKGADTLRQRFLATEAEARSVYADKADVIIQSQRADQLALTRLTQARNAGDLTQDEFESKVAALV